LFDLVHSKAKNLKESFMLWRNDGLSEHMKLGVADGVVAASNCSISSSVRDQLKMSIS